MLSLDTYPFTMTNAVIIFLFSRLLFYFNNNTLWYFSSFSGSLRNSIRR